MAMPRRPIGQPAAPACPEIPNPGENYGLEERYAAQIEFDVTAIRKQHNSKTIRTDQKGGYVLSVSIERTTGELQAWYPECHMEQRQEIIETASTARLTCVTNELKPFRGSQEIITTG